ncbi:hypothetical protein J2S47_005450 [Streptomyces griseoviridis]|uniref:Uncharacterized protein n=1 Tax=Streptomyces griseoviridis TaxID=45398 RepID=A0ABT9LN32_STRGD|nr:hypothetical protein [Streptomyces griseoviridis]GGT17861.1 hypothetical protein GCM10010240_58790 [Streptomyces griseoviridis]
MSWTTAGRCGGGSERFQVSHTTAARRASRYRHLGAAGMHDRPSRPRHSPRQTPAPVGQRVLRLRLRLRLRREHRIGPVRPAARCGIAASTAPASSSGTMSRAVAAVVVGAAGRPAEDLVAAAVGDPAGLLDGEVDRFAGPGAVRSRLSAHRPGRPHPLAHTEDPPGEKAATCAAFPRRAAAWFAR